MVCAAPPTARWRERIAPPYLMALMLPLARCDGHFWADPLWAKDLLLHLNYIEQLILFCPVDAKAPPPDWVKLDHPGLTILPSGPSGRRALLALPLTTMRLAGAVRRATIVHTGVAGWPYPLGWIATPLARLRRRFLVVIIESSFWRAPPGAGPLKRAKAWLSERINRACVNRADVALFTTEQYRASLATRPRGLTAITPASWLDEAQVLSSDEVEARWAAKPDRLLFAGRLTREKGVDWLLAALERCDAAVDIVGEGELALACRAVAERHPNRIRVLAPVSYGDAFSDLLDGYVGIVVPTLSDEQPRILFDAFARGLPAIASDTAANVELVGDNGLGLLVPRNDPDALAGAITRALADRPGLHDMGRRARDFTATRTHEAMHRHRAALLAAALDDRS